jgi:protein CWC15
VRGMSHFSSDTHSSADIHNSGETNAQDEHANGDDDGDEEEEEDDEEDDTAELLRELEKIKRERAAEKARVEEAEAAATEAEREAQIATANPLLNLAAALGNAPGINTTAPGTFAVKRRWDDGAFLRYLTWITAYDICTSIQTSFSRTRQ